MFYHEKIDVKVKRKENYKKQQAQTELQLQLTGLDLRGMSNICFPTADS